METLVSCLLQPNLRHFPVENSFVFFNTNMSLSAKASIPLSYKEVLSRYSLSYASSIFTVGTVLINTTVKLFHSMLIFCILKTTVRQADTGL